MRFLFLTVWLAFVPVAAHAGAKEKEAYLIFNRYCMVAMADLSAMPSLMEKKRKSVTRLSKEEAESRIGQPASMWQLRTKMTAYYIFTLGNGVCGVEHASLDFKSMKSVIEGKMKVKMFAHSDDERMVLASYYTKVRPRAKIHGKKAKWTEIELDILTGKIASNKKVTRIVAVARPLSDKLKIGTKKPAKCVADNGKRVVCV